MFDKYLHLCVFGPFHILNSYLLSSQMGWAQNFASEIPLKKLNWRSTTGFSYKTLCIRPAQNPEKSRDFHQPQIPGSRDSRDPAKACSPGLSVEQEPKRFEVHTCNCRFQICASYTICRHVALVRQDNNLCQVLRMKSTLVCVTNTNIEKQILKSCHIES